jgi:hypothetical protein
MIERLRRVPPQAWVAAVVVIGLVFLMWQRFQDDVDDTSWTDVSQPPMVAALPPMLCETGPAHGSGRPMACNVGFRSRRYDDVLSADLGGFSLGAQVMLGGGCR